MLILFNLTKSVTYRFFRLLTLSLILIIPFTLLPIISSSHFLIISDAWSATYFVDATNGNNSNNGLTMSSAWKTIAKFNDPRFDPGNQILFKRGEEGVRLIPYSLIRVCP